jgi:3-deoxy-D-manno-octulosonate 8-phosphate phosphatase (KDO 8-P phosphatase)
MTSAMAIRLSRKNPQAVTLTLKARLGFMRLMLCNGSNQTQSRNPGACLPAGAIDGVARSARLRGQMAKRSADDLKRRLKNIRCLLLDVDGVLTDGTVYFHSDGGEAKGFSIQDGHAISMALRGGLQIGFISGRPSRVTELRAEDLGVKIVRQGKQNKMEMVEQIKTERGYRDDEIAFVGDDLVDLPVLRRIGLPLAVANATGEIKGAAVYVTKRRGGDGAVREVIEMILKAQGSWKNVMAKYLAMFAVSIAVSITGFAAESNRPAATGFIEKFEVPERDEGGNLKWKLNGDRAVFRDDGLMNIVNARAEFYSSNRVDMVFTSPTCLLDRANNRAVTDAPVRIERSDMIVTGNGGDWDGNKSSLVVRHNVRVILTSGAAIPSEQPKEATKAQ